MKREILYKEIKNLKCRENGRSSNFTTPSFILGCAGTCQFCYVHRNTKNIQIARNVDEVLNSIENQFKGKFKSIPDQCDDEYILLDISCNTDIGLHYKHFDWKKVFDFFKTSPNLKATFATKQVREELIEYCPEKKVRMRYSMRPQNVSDIIIPKMSTNIEKINAANRAVNNDWEIHYNFSPVIVKDNWLNEYKELFQSINDISSQELKNQIACEVIFLTHEEKFHEYNLSLGKDESLLWNPTIQESKKSLYGGNNIRYKYQLKDTYIKEYKKLISKEMSYCNIRYIF